MQRTKQLEPRLLAYLGRFYKLLLYAYPPRFRQEYGGWMAQLFRDEARFLLKEGRATALILFLIRTLFDLIKTIPVEQLEERFNLKMEQDGMAYYDSINRLADQPEQLEQLYHDAVKAGHKNGFQQAIVDHYKNAPSNLLLAGWFHRLNYAAKQAKRFIIAWHWVIPLAILNGFWFWWLSDDKQFMIQIAGGRSQPQNFLPAIFLWAAPLSTLFILIYFTLVAKKDWSAMGLAAVVPLLGAVYVTFTYAELGIRPFQQQYLFLMLFHLPLLAWASVGAFLLVQQRDANSRLRFLLKSVEVILGGGIFTGVLYVFSGITIGLFSALDIEFPTTLLRLIFAGGLGLNAVIASVILYNPTLPPDEQTLAQGLSRLISVLMQVLLPLTFLVLVIYIAFIPTNFQAPFNNRDVLIIYNIMLFAVVGLLVGVTILRPADMSPQRERWLRRLIIGVALLTLLVSLYALSAILFRTINDRLTPNRLTMMGWNIINIGLLVLVLVMQWRAKKGQWLEGLYQAFSWGTAVYVIWTGLVIFALPWFFGVSQGDMAQLPERIQDVVFTEPSPVLLKCNDSPHIYLLDRGAKRWIQDIETFNQRGYVWNDVNLVFCGDLRQIPDGTPIPAEAGPPPQP